MKDDASYQNGMINNTMTWLKSNSTIVLLIGILAYSTLILFGKKFDVGTQFFPTLLLTVATFPIVVQWYNDKREKALAERISLLIFLLFFALAYIFSSTRNYGLSELMVFSACIVIYLTLAHSTFFSFRCTLKEKTALKTPCIEYARMLLSAITIIGLISVLIGYFYYLTRPAARFYGSFLNADSISENWPNAFALFMLMVWPLALQISEKRWSIQKAVLISLLLSGLFLTYSRAAALVFLIQLFVLALFYYREIFKKTLWLKLGSIVIMVFIVITASNMMRTYGNFEGKNLELLSVKEKAGFANEEKRTSIDSRKAFWIGGIKLALEKPIFGHGPYSFRFTYPRIQKAFLETSDHPHNLFIKIAAELGFPATFALLAFFIIFFKTLIRRFQFIDEKNKHTAILLVTAIVGALLHSQLDYNLNFISNIFLFFILLALLRSMIAFPQLNEKSKLKMLSVLAAILLVVSLFEGTLSLIAKRAYVLEARAEREKDLQKSAQLYRISEKYFSYYEKTLFPREYYMERFKKFMSEGNIDLAKEAIIKHIENFNAIDAEAWERKGEILREQGRYQDAYQAFREALTQNPMNHFWYYWNFIDIAHRIGEKKSIDALKPNLVRLLTDYEYMLEKNMYFTQKTPNAEGAIKVLQLLALVYPQESEAFLQKKEVFQKLRNL